MTYCNGRSFIGEWHEDVKHGFGREFDEDKNLVFEGHYENGEYLNGTFYDGDFFYKYWRYSSDKPEFVQETENLSLDYSQLGFVEIYSSDWSLKYKGGFKSGQMHGYGMYFYSNGNVYNGGWHEDTMHGRGRLSFMRKVTKQEIRETLGVNDLLNNSGSYSPTIGSPTQKNQYISPDFYGKNYVKGTTEAINDKESKYKSPILGYDPYSSQSQKLSRQQQYKLDQERLIDSLAFGKHSPQSKYSTNKSMSQSSPAKKFGSFIKNVDSPVKQDMLKVTDYTATMVLQKEYEGDFLLGEMCGKGRLFNAQGRLMFEGRFKDNNPNGFGIEYLADGKIYEGTFQDGKKSGSGKIYDSNGEMMYDGNFKNGLMHGLGQLYYENGDLYKGNFVNNMKHGAGTFSKPNGTYYQGTWVRNKKLEFGKGRIMNMDDKSSMKGDVYSGVEYSGNTKGTKPHGPGVLIQADDTVYAGTFKNGNIHGAGAMTMNKQDQIYVGKFNKSTPSGNAILIRADDGLVVGKGVLVDK